MSKLYERYPKFVPAAALVGKRYKTYFGGVDVVLGATEHPYRVTVQDVKTGQVRTHCTQIEYSELVD